MEDWDGRTPYDERIDQLAQSERDEQDGPRLHDVRVPRPSSDREGTKTRCRAVRYEVRRWKDGTIADAEEAVASPLRVSESMSQARNLLALTESVPSCVWGRDELGLGEMWNSNSVISWLLASAEIPTDEIQPPTGGRVPGWATGILVAEEMLLSESSGMANNELDVLLRLNIASIEAPHRKDKHHHRAESEPSETHKVNAVDER